MVLNKKNGRPRKQDVRRYGKNETGTRTFLIENLEAEVSSYVRKNGDAYIGTEYSGYEITGMILRKKDETNNA